MKIRPFLTMIYLLVFTLAVSQLCEAQKPVFAFITQEHCPPCKQAKLVFEKLKLEHKLDEYSVFEFDLNQDSALIASMGLPKFMGIPRVMTPTFVILDQDWGVRHALNRNDEQEVRDFATQLPSDCIEPVFLPVEDEPPVTFGANGVEITWDLATEYRNGAYNGTYAFNKIQSGLDAFRVEGYDVTFRRVTRGGAYHVVQASSDLGKDVAARTGPNTTRISPVFRYTNPAQCMMVICHEFLHTRIQAHTPTPGFLMHANGGYKISPAEGPYLNRWKRIPGIKLPWEDPDRFKKTLLAKAAAAFASEEPQVLAPGQYEGKLK